MQAACYGDPGTVSFLLESGADAAALNIDGRSAIDLALKQGWNEVADLLANWTSNQRR